MVSLFKKKTRRKYFNYEIPKKIEKKYNVIEKIDISKYPLNFEISLSKHGKVIDEKTGKERKIEIKEPFIYKLLIKSSNIVQRYVFLEPIRKKFEKMTEEYVKNTHFPYPSYSYSSLLAIIFLLMGINFLLVGVGFIFSKLVGYVLMSVSTIWLIVLMYLMNYPKKLVKSLSSELGDILLMWYSISKAGLPPQQQIAMIYNILEKYRLLNEQLPGKMKMYTFYYVFKDMYYDIELKNISLINAFEKQVRKIKDETVKTMFLRMLRSMKSGVDLSDVIFDELTKLHERENREIQKSGEKIYMLLQLYMIVLVMLLGMLSIIRLVVGATIGPDYIMTTLNKMLLISVLGPIFLALVIGMVVKGMTDKYARPKDFKVPISAHLMAFLSFIIVFFVFPRMAVNKTMYILTLTIGIIPAIYAIKKVKSVRKIIETAENELPERLIEVSSTLNMGVRLSDALRSGVTTTDYTKMEFADIIFLYLSSYMNIGKSLSEVFYRFIMKIPSRFIRSTLGIIALTEEYSGNFAEFIGTIGELTSQQTEVVDLVKVTISPINWMIPMSSLVMILILGFISSIIPPLSTVMVKFQGGMDTFTAYETFGGVIAKIVSTLVPGQGLIHTDSEIILLQTAIFAYNMMTALGFAISISLIRKLTDDLSLPELVSMTIIYYVVFLLILYGTQFKYIYEGNEQGLLGMFGINLSSLTKMNTSGLGFGF